MKIRFIKLTVWPNLVIPESTREGVTQAKVGVGAGWGQGRGWGVPGRGGRERTRLPENFRRATYETRLRSSPQRPRGLRSPGPCVHSCPHGAQCWTGDELFLSRAVVVGATRTRHGHEKAEGSRRGSRPPVCVSTRRTRLEPGFLRVARAHAAPPGLRSTSAAACSPAWFSGPDSCHSPRRASQPKMQRGGWGGRRAPKDPHTRKSPRRHCSLACDSRGPRAPPAHPKPHLS